MDVKVRDPSGTAAFLSEALGWCFAVDEEDWRQATKITIEGYRIGRVSDNSRPRKALGWETPAERRHKILAA
ncbi:hypothetical protein GCM10010365_57970 [Streptomyces poonensis]|uniref:Uncharacterized protein n=2 Tax=Streptomyces poonensis TaxID=68255 RepID=A0A918Q3Y3_9ACTN|nr:hypothetical protein GCM10010365_57970 [Streptomyces poonensis]